MKFKIQMAKGKCQMSPFLYEQVGNGSADLLLRSAAFLGCHSKAADLENQVCATHSPPTRRGES